MIATNKILPIALVAALAGGSVGALVMHRSNTEPAATTAATTQTATTTQPAATNNLATAPANTTDQTAPANMTQDEQLAYRDGFTDGFNTAAGQDGRVATNRTVVERVSSPTRVVTRTRYVGSRSGSAPRAYYDYSSQPRGRSFWQKHRNKLTVAMGAGGGAILGGLIGGKRGAAIGALAGAGGSALYTYKLRHRSRRY